MQNTEIFFFKFYFLLKVYEDTNLYIYAVPDNNWISVLKQYIIPRFKIFPESIKTVLHTNAKYFRNFSVLLFLKYLNVPLNYQLLIL